MTTPPDDLTTLVQQLTEAMAKATTSRHWQNSYFCKPSGEPIATVEDVADTIAGSARYSDRAELFGVSLDDAAEHEDGRATVLCYTGNGPNAHNNAAYIALCSPSNLARLLAALTEQQTREEGLRRWLWLNHGCRARVLYGDDGEMQCNVQDGTHPGNRFLDFKRDDLPSLVVAALNGAEARAMQAEQRAEELEAIIAAIGHEKDELRARMSAAESRRVAAEHRAQRIVLDAELQAEVARLTRELAEARKEGQREG